MDEPAYNDEICEPKYERYPEKQLCSLGHVILPGDGLVASILPVFPRSSVRVPNGTRFSRRRANKIPLATIGGRLESLVRQAAETLAAMQDVSATNG